jgi:hypothetical protein
MNSGNAIHCDATFGSSVGCALKRPDLFLAGDFKQDLRMPYVRTGAYMPSPHSQRVRQTRHVFRIFAHIALVFQVFR